MVITESIISGIFGILFGIFVSVIAFIILSFFKKEIEFQYLYLKVFLMFLCAGIYWTLTCGTLSFSILWQKFGSKDEWYHAKFSGNNLF